MLYLDYHATTPCDPLVIEAMVPYLAGSYGNPSSSIHSAGREAHEAADMSRQAVAEMIGARRSEIVFTGGATESNNLAILGVARGAKGVRKRVVTTTIEHKSVLTPCSILREHGYECIQLPVGKTGLVNLGVAETMIDQETLLVSVQAANNEIGTIQSVRHISDIAHNRGALVHCDAAQAAAKIPIDVDDWDVDLLSLSAHKFYGPKGVGALFVRGGPYALPIKPLMFGGGQEHELRPGTLNVPGIVGMGAAAKLAKDGLVEEAKRIGRLRDLFEKLIVDSVINVKVNGALDRRLAGNSSIAIFGVDAEALIFNTPELAISTGSACTSGAPEPSHVLLAIGMSRQDAYNTIRIGLGRFTTGAEVNRAAELIIAAVERLRKLQ